MMIYVFEFVAIPYEVIPDDYGLYAYDIVHSNLRVTCSTRIQGLTRTMEMSYQHLHEPHCWQIL